MENQFKVWLGITIAYIISATVFNVIYYLKYGKGPWFLATDIIGALLILITIFVKIRK